MSMPLGKGRVGEVYQLIIRNPETNQYEDKGKGLVTILPGTKEKTRSVLFREGEEISAYQLNYDSINSRGELIVRESKEIPLEDEELANQLLESRGISIPRELKIGRVYPTIIGNKEVGNALYLGRSSSAREHVHMVAYYNEKDNVEVRRFGEHSWKGEKLWALFNVKQNLDVKERRLLEERLKRADI